MSNVGTLLIEAEKCFGLNEPQQNGGETLSKSAERPEQDRAAAIAETGTRWTWPTVPNFRLALGFWEAGIIGTLMVTLFPWSLLFCLYFFGMEKTISLVMVLVHDAVQTVLAILSVLFSLVVLIALAFAGYFFLFER